MAPTRRRLLGAAGVAYAAVAGCIRDPGRGCSGATYRLSLSPADPAGSGGPLNLDPDTLSREADAVVETALEGEHVEHCVAWEPGGDETGPSPGLREVGERIEAHAGVELAGRTEDVTTDATRGGETYRLHLDIEAGRG